MFGTKGSLLAAAIALVLLHPAAASPEARTETPEGLEDELLEWEPAERVRDDDPRAREWSLRLRRGLYVRRQDGRHELRLLGRLVLDGGVLRYDQGLPGAKQTGWNAEGALRQGRVGAQGVVFDRFLFQASYEFEDLELRDLFVGVRGLGPLGTVQVGHMKEPFSLEWETGVLHLPFMERSLPDALAPRRSTGLLATNTHLERRVRWAVGAFAVQDEPDSSDETLSGFDNDWDLAARVTGLPIDRDEGRHLLNVGASYSHTFANGDDVRISTPPESFLADDLLATGDISDVRSLDRFAAEALYVRGALAVQGELLGSFFDRRRGGDPFYWGGYVQVTRFLTGEHVIYGRRAGRLGRVRPIHPFDRSLRHWGALQLAARFSFLDLEDADVTGARGLGVTLGLNWHPTANSKLMFNGIWGRVLDQGNVFGAQLRLQVDY